MSGEDERATGPIDVEVLRSVCRRLANDDRFRRVEFDPSPSRIRNLVARYDESLFPDRVQRARLEIRWYVGGDHSVHYLEESTDETRWECRWDRHPKPVGRTHFHPPPDAGQAVSAEFPSDYRDVLSLVLTYVSERIDGLWDGSP
ncbi:hypothetical protein EL22_19785 [Halostagnicola sp. A56]|uniref:hypothetical protein n=1 Tax=Halostagnicola sp. A56 TaxID=1495067 RepID=UPI00049FF48C|nr:hypothetical protein [Halostagnicola sp. A56]KDE60533.1 hypothetical protein EL22_19785 [Halostagnicola sp. A56]